MPPETTSLLKAEGIDAGYGTMQVLWGVDLDVRPGETVLLLGANGAGKTTFLKSLVGLIEARSGNITLADRDITKMRSSDRMKLGMTYMSELAVFPDLSIEENIRVGAQALVDELHALCEALVAVHPRRLRDAEQDGPDPGRRGRGRHQAHVPGQAGDAGVKGRS